MKRSLLKIFGKKDTQEKVITPEQPQEANIDLPTDLYSFVYLPNCQGWIGKYPVTNLQYQRFLEAEDFAEERFWVDFPKYAGAPEDYECLGDWGDRGLWWLQESLKDKEFSPDGKRVVPCEWHNKDFGIQRPGVPVVGITWYEANAYCRWLQAHWSECEEAQQNPELGAGVLRLPLACEWLEAAGENEFCYAWDPPGIQTTDIDEIVRRANVSQSKLDRTTPVNQYPLGQSPLGVWDLCGNVWEWQANLEGAGLSRELEMRGRSWLRDAEPSYRRDWFKADLRYYDVGLRLFFLPLTARDPEKDIPSDLYTFVFLPQCQGWIGKYPVTNLQYQRFLEAEDFAEKRFWVDFPKYGPSPDYELQGTWGDEGWRWLQKTLQGHEDPPQVSRHKVSPDGRRVVPYSWHYENFGIQRPLVPVVGVNWYEANAYCRWLQAHWSECEEARQNPDLPAGVLRLPTEVEWVEAAGGTYPLHRYPWDPPGKVTPSFTQITKSANISGSEIQRTTRVHKYPLGQSPLGVWDMAGNVREWQANLRSNDDIVCVVRGGSFYHDKDDARAESRYQFEPNDFIVWLGFRVIRLAI